MTELFKPTFSILFSMTPAKDWKTTVIYLYSLSERLASRGTIKALFETPLKPLRHNTVLSHEGFKRGP